MKNTKTISKLAMFVATLAAGATIASIHVAAHADVLYAPGLTDAQKKEADDVMNSVSDNQAQIDAINNSYAKHDSQPQMAITQTNHYVTPDNKTSVAQKKTTKKVVKKHVAKKKVAKKARKKVVKKAKAKKLFRIRVKAHKIYAYKTIKLHKAGRKAEYKGTKLNVYKIVKKGHKTYYKVYGGRVITANKHFVTKIAK
ncbi:hypothetical protein AKUH3B110M_UNKNOWN200020 (plasmid) [Apilactobacillus kunkeei]|nr:hypothetical protein AKUH3B110M_UNKNOWN200020 [Apilactobacillus kunkeei]CAI2700356.1 hypothetical protein AKUH3B107A_UNKNOWN200020 [Apilactobacillus kunkeei]CAI2700368.1 hypothetical protein AKUH3B102X_UNKNOWN200020 [Apilactobacillus kunkeei]